MMIGLLMNAKAFQKKYNVSNIIMAGLKDKLHINDESMIPEKVFVEGYELFTGLKLNFVDNNEIIEVEPKEIFSLKKKPKKEEIINEENNIQ